MRLSSEALLVVVAFAIGGHSAHPSKTMWTFVLVLPKSDLRYINTSCYKPLGCGIDNKYYPKCHSSQPCARPITPATLTCVSLNDAKLQARILEKWLWICLSHIPSSSRIAVAMDVSVRQSDIRELAELTEEICILARVHLRDHSRQFRRRRIHMQSFDMMRTIRNGDAN
ncbi:uncharacterized protein RSE6_09253 [Rhynchosporium secalis]|uniref:Secreted protein n=1 Tax=Rhynchosporium secalis TaxID=38038 RepID=A0A1E1MHG3_RHYSE|nr:uncharacterized protein RSE6_09253 [Rhynchosporium secalis]